MAATSARIGFGSLLKRGDGGSPTEVFSTIAEVVSLSGIGSKLGTVDATHMESPDRFMEKIPGILESSEVSVELSFLPDDTSHGLLRADHLAATKRNFQITIPGSAKVWSFAAFVSQFEVSQPHDGKMSASLVLTPTGKKTLA